MNGYAEAKQKYIEWLQKEQALAKHYQEESAKWYKMFEELKKQNPQIETLFEINGETND